MTHERLNPGPRVRAHQDAGRGTVRVPYPVGIRTARVIERRHVTPHMLRLTLAGPEIADLHSYACDDHVGVVFPLPDGRRNDPTFNPERQMLDWHQPAPPMRKYTIRRHDPEAGQIDLDVVLHPGGLASQWAAGLTVGDDAVLAGPPGSLAFPHTYRRYVFAVDTTALPAVARWLDEADWIEERGVRVDVLIDHDHQSETTYPLRDRRGVEIGWLDRSRGSGLAQAVAAVDLGGSDPNDVFLFAAGEAGDLKPLRTWAKQHGIDALVTGYWKRGAVDHEEHDDEHDSPGPDVPAAPSPE